MPAYWIFAIICVGVLGLFIGSLWTKKNQALLRSHLERDYLKDIEGLKQKLGFIEAQLHFTEAQLRQEQEKALKLYKTLEENLSEKFEGLVAKTLTQNSQHLLGQQTLSLNQLLDPFKEKLKDFEKRVEETYSVERNERGQLKGELHKILELNQIMSQEAQNLTRALKGDNKTQGLWGEMILESILERSGLRPGQEFTVQGQDLRMKDNEGSRLLPDVVVHLPGGKHIIVDSKVTLKAFESYCSSESPHRDSYAKLHLKSIEDHISQLSQKKYHLADQVISPDFVILFMPLEPAFALAFQLRPDLMIWSWEKNVAIVSPTTLLTTLRTIASLWKQERQQKNAIEIARRGGLLYEKFASFIGDVNLLGEKLSSAQKAHIDLTKKLSEGKGNLLNQIEGLKELGAKTEKRLPVLESLESSGENKSC